MTLEKEIKKAVEEKKIVIGTHAVLRSLRQGELESVISASNCPEKIKADIEHNSKMAKTAAKQFDGTSVDLGALCVKPFKIAVVGILKQ